VNHPAPPQSLEPQLPRTRWPKLPIRFRASGAVPHLAAVRHDDWPAASGSATGPCPALAAAQPIGNAQCLVSWRFGKRSIPKLFSHDASAYTGHRTQQRRHPVNHTKGQPGPAQNNGSISPASQMCPGPCQAIGPQLTRPWRPPKPRHLGMQERAGSTRLPPFNQRNRK
jgi:hypothetical protein